MRRRGRNEFASCVDSGLAADGLCGVCVSLRLLLLLLLSLALGYSTSSFQEGKLTGSKRDGIGPIKRTRVWRRRRRRRRKKIFFFFLFALVVVEGFCRDQGVCTLLFFPFLSFFLIHLIFESSSESRFSVLYLLPMYIVSVCSHWKEREKDYIDDDEEMTSCSS